MGLFHQQEKMPYHPRQEPRISGELTADHVRQVFSDCVDFSEREVLIGGDPEKRVVMFSIVGMARNERVNDYVLRPIATSPLLRECHMEQAFEHMITGAVYNGFVEVRTTMDQVAEDIINGSVVFAFPHRGEMLSFAVPTEEKRSISDPSNEPSIKGAKDSFVESIRTNTSLVRRRLRAPELKIKEEIVGRQTLTPVDVLYLDGIANPDLVQEALERVRGIDIDAVLATGNLEEYIIDETDTVFPLVSYTERPDRFCGGLVEGRVGIIADGIPLGYLIPGTVGQFLRTGDDRSRNWLAASCLSALRYLCVLLTLFLPAFYIAVVNFHPEMLPARLALSIAEARLNVPFSTVFEVLILLLAFEIVQEAGYRLPSPIGQTVSILGGLVVGTAVVQAKIVSPAVLVVAATAGIAGYTVPSQELSGALRIGRFLLAVAASLGGLFAMTLAGAALVYRLSALESFGVPYWAPFAAGTEEERAGHGIIRWPLPWVKLRERSLKTENRRNQR